MLVFAIIKNLPPKEKRVLFYSRFVYTNNKTNLNKGKEEICLAYLFSFLGNIHLYFEYSFSFGSNDDILYENNFI